MVATRGVGWVVAALCATAGGAKAQPASEEPTGPTMEIYGFAMLDMGFDVGQIGDPNWQDTLRPTKLPAFDDQFGEGSRWFSGVRQSRFGVKANVPTEDLGELKTTFEFELFGVGPDEGQTTFRLRHAVADWNQLRAGQTWSPFMDIDVFPNSIEYWGPNGMPFFRNVQLAWMPIQGDTRVTVALERPGASADRGDYEQELMGVVGRFPLPDLSAEARYAGPWGYVEVAGIARYIAWDSLDPTSPVDDGEVFGWGVTASSNIKLGPHVAKLQAVYGEAIQNYMNDATVDVGVNADGDDGEALPLLGLVAFVDLNWSETLTSTAGWSMVWMDNSAGQAPDAFHIGHYALANVLVHPREDLFFGPEIQWGRRENNDDGYEVDDLRFQVSVKGSFSRLFEGP
jgi:hypothetical protein